MQQRHRPALTKCCFTPVNPQSSVLAGTPGTPGTPGALPVHFRWEQSQEVERGQSDKARLGRHSLTWELCGPERETLQRPPGDGHSWLRISALRSCTGRPDSEIPTGAPRRLEAALRGPRTAPVAKRALGRRRAPPGVALLEAQPDRLPQSPLGGGAGDREVGGF